MSNPVNLMASIKKVGKKGALQITSDDLIFDPDDKVLCKAIANAMVVQIRENLERGQGPAFEPLPTISAATVERRLDEEAQGRRGGAADDRFKDNAFRYTVRNNHTRDYTAARLGSFSPKSGGPRGIVSGMLSQSFSARVNRDGKGVSIFVAAKRGQPRPAGTSGRAAETKSALENVFGNVPIWSQPANNSPQIKKAMFKACKAILGTNILDLKKFAKDVGASLLDTIDTVESMEESSE